MYDKVRDSKVGQVRLSFMRLPSFSEIAETLNREPRSNDDLGPFLFVSGPRSEEKVTHNGTHSAEIFNVLRIYYVYFL